MSKQSFYYSLCDALDGIRHFVFTERNAKIQLAVTLAIIILAATLRISITEWLIILLCIGAVISCELMNTAIETLCNTLHPQRSTSIKHVKHLSAGAVLCIAIIASIIGCIILLPKLFIYAS
jgi:diacylglycerol kinase